MAKQRTGSGPTEPPASEDAHAFRAAVRDVKPLLTAATPAGLRPTSRVRRVRKDAVHAPRESLDEVMPLIVGSPLPDVATDLLAEGVGAAEPLAFQRAGVRTQVVRRLRRGLYPVEDELDLHGLTQTHARDQLASFLESSRSAGRRCVRIIHGKGYRSGSRGPILKIAVNLWLRRHRDVMAFVSAKAIDGGTGALYVLLRA